MEPGEIHFEVEELDEFIEESGVTVDLYPSIVCPCLREQSGQPDPTCPLCEGLGHLWEETPTETRMLLTTDELQKQFKVPGAWRTGEVNCTAQSGITLADGDRIVPHGERIIVNDELLTRGALSVQGKTLEVLRLRFPQEILGVRDINQSYEEDVDFELNGRVITWLSGGDAPSVGERYSVKYSARAEYIVFSNQPRVRTDADVQIPWFARLLRLDVHRRRLGMGDLS